MGETQQMWLVHFKKQIFLNEQKVLVPTDRLTEVVAHFSQLYDDWDESADFITIRPTEMRYYG